MSESRWISVLLSSLGVTEIFWFTFPQGPDREDSKNLAMFKAVLKKNRDGGKGSKKDSGMWKIRRKYRKQTSTSYPKGLDTSLSVFVHSFLMMETLCHE